MASRKTIYLSDAAESVIGDHQTASLSGRINSILIRYQAITDEACPTLSESEWSAIMDAGNGMHLADDTRDSLRFLWAEIADADRLDGLGEKWGIDALALAQRVQAMSLAELCAVAEVLAKFWASPDLNGLETGDLLRQCGARVK